MDARIAALEAVIAKKRDLKQAAMQQLLTGKTRLPGFSGEWEVKRLGEISGYHHERCNADNIRVQLESQVYCFYEANVVSARGLDLSQSMFIS